MLRDSRFGRRPVQARLSGGWLGVLVTTAACGPAGLTDPTDGAGTDLAVSALTAEPITEGEPASAPIPFDCTSGRPGVGIDGVWISEYLQAALDRAPAGATIELCPAAYQGPYVAPRPVHLVGVGGAATTTLESLSGGTVLTMPPGSTVSGFTIRGGDTAIGGGLLLVGPGTFRVEGCVVTNNRADRGGGIAVDGAAVATLVDTTVSDNDARSGGGLFVGPGASVQLFEASIGGNRAASTGGGVTLDGGSLSGGEVADNDVVDSQVDGGAGIFATGTATVSATRVTGNQGASAPGIRVQDGAVTLDAVTVTGNLGADDTSAGGGLSCQGANVTLYGTRISGNLAAEGGGIWAHECTLSGGTVSGNESVADGGGVVLFQSTLFQATVTANTAGGYPSGVWLVGEAELVESLVSGHGSDRAAIEAGPNSRIVGSTIADNPTCGVLVSGQLTLDSAAILRNESGACVLGGFDPTASLISLASDWGSGENDNTTDLSWGESYTGYGADATFSCADGCDPVP